MKERHCFEVHLYQFKHKAPKIQFLFAFSIVCVDHGFLVLWTMNEVGTSFAVLTFQLSLAAFSHFLSVILAWVGISMENVITNGSVPLERCLEGNVSLHYKLKKLQWSIQSADISVQQWISYTVKICFSWRNLKAGPVMKGKVSTAFWVMCATYV